MTRVEIGIPSSKEYDPYYAGYVSRVRSADVLAALRSQRPEVLDLLNGLSETAADYRYAPGKWSVKEIIGHLMDTERVFVYRALSVARGERQPLPGFEQDDYVREGSFDSRSVRSLASEYDAVRCSTLTLFESLDGASWKKTGIANETPCSVRAIAFIVAGHEAHHLAVIRERYLASG
jgi:hypothetical protein